MIAVDQSTYIVAQLEALSMKVDALIKGKVQVIMSVCDLCTVTHATD